MEFAGELVNVHAVLGLSLDTYDCGLPHDRAGAPFLPKSPSNTRHRVHSLHATLGGLLLGNSGLVRYLQYEASGAMRNAPHRLPRTDWPGPIDQDGAIPWIGRLILNF